MTGVARRTKPTKGAGSPRKVRVGVVVGPTIDARKPVGPKIDLSKMVGPKVDASKLVGPTVDISKLIGPSADLSKVVGTSLDASKLIGPKLDIEKLIGSKVDVSKLVGTSLDASKLVGSKVDLSKVVGTSLDASKLIGPKLDVEKLIGATLHGSRFSDGLVAPGGIATAFAVPDIDISKLIGAMPVAEFLGSRIDVSALVGPDVAVTDLLGDRLEASALLGESFEVDSLDQLTLESLGPSTGALAQAVLSRIDELQAEFVDRLDRVESAQTLRRQLVLLVLGAVLSLLLTVALAQMAPHLIAPESRQSGTTTPTISNTSKMHHARRSGRHNGRRAHLNKIEHINVYLQDQLRARGLGEVRAVEAARWLDDAGVLSDSQSRHGLPLRKLLRAGVITGAEQRPDRPHGRWFIVRT
jgi:hypothetical protein